MEQERETDSMKDKGRKGTHIAIFVLLAGMIAALAGIMCFKFLQHEKRQNADIEELRQIAYAGRKETEKTPAPPEALQLYRMTEEKLNQLFLEEGGLNAYQMLACGQDINLLIVGDSIGALQWTHDVSTWIAGNYQVNCTIKNLSMGGNNSFGGFVSEKLLDDAERYDLAVVCYGQNDRVEPFAAEYEALIRELLRRNERCCIICVLESPQREYTEKMRKIVELADYYGLQTADTIEAFENSGYAYEKLTLDGTHPNDLGEEIYAQTVETVIRDNVAAEYARKSEMFWSAFSGEKTLNASGYSYPAALKEALDKSVSAFEHFRWFPSSSFRRVSDTEWEMRTDGFSGILGISRNMCPGINHLRIFVNDALFYDSGEEDWKINFQLMTVDRLADEPANFEGTIRISLSTKECADAFFGLAFICYEDKGK